MPGLGYGGVNCKSRRKSTRPATGRMEHLNGSRVFIRTYDGGLQASNFTLATSVCAEDDGAKQA